MELIKALPAEVLAALAPAVALVQGEARAGTVTVERSRAIRTGKTYVRANGAEYRPGAAAILDTVYPGARLDDETVPVILIGSDDQDEDEDEDDDDDDTCEDENACGYCGCCSECETIHDIDDVDVLTSPRGERYCLHNCEHWCDT